MQESTSPITLCNRLCIVLAQALGGLGALYLISHNYRMFNNKSTAQRTLIYGTLVIFIFYVIMVVFPQIPGTVIYVSIAMTPSLFEGRLGRDVEKAINEGTKKYSHIKYIGVVSASLIASAIFYNCAMIFAKLAESLANLII